LIVNFIVLSSLFFVLYVRAIFRVIFVGVFVTGTVNSNVMLVFLACYSRAALSNIGLLKWARLKFNVHVTIKGAMIGNLIVREVS
jgi:hypothetical protein